MRAVVGMTAVLSTASVVDLIQGIFVGGEVTVLPTVAVGLMPGLARGMTNICLSALFFPCWQCSRPNISRWTGCMST